MVIHVIWTFPWTKIYVNVFCDNILKRIPLVNIGAVFGMYCIWLCNGAILAITWGSLTLVCCLTPMILFAQQATFLSLNLSFKLPPLCIYVIWSLSCCCTKCHSSAWNLMKAFCWKYACHRHGSTKGWSQPEPVSVSERCNDEDQRHNLLLCSNRLAPRRVFFARRRSPHASADECRWGSFATVTPGLAGGGLAGARDWQSHCLAWGD